MIVSWLELPDAVQVRKEEEATQHRLDRDKARRR